MITEWVMDVVVQLLEVVIGQLPESEPPAWMYTASTWSGRVFQFAGSMGVWFPWGLLGMVFMAVITAWGVGFGIKVARMVISFLTAGGGSAA